MNFKYHHKPVLIKESIENLITDQNGIYVDATFGGGGHSYELLKKLNKKATLIALDQDKESIKKNWIKDKRFHLFHNNFIHIRDILNQNHINKISGILVDLGISSYQIDNPIRGFSNRFNCILDMRMNQESFYSAQNVLNECSKEKLFHIFSEYGEFKNAKKIVNKILKKRLKKNITTTLDLIHIFFIKGSFKKRKRFFSRLFQSIRIEVNNEINILKNFLLESSKILFPEGRIAVISYHSIEDRIIKYFFKKGIIINKINLTPLPFRMIHKKVIKPSYQEIRKNPRSRSARLRIAEKI
ncbi:Ribosomal RNA small subunit methyltransferase H [Blattabacterium sp. (Nauphoeta cinerea)]|uniref:16S rRNA (cytosine(1402)-N(4))-methyltransferase RsmH n=1 Tax=Blattabacterium sp. (Nauphoeta cinerea) TaxID=1316444 RepID=UPI0003B0A1E0|nr:16S rRNA (cytosine(1402)-N(4))-methyltransferase RsmH [Blattabacterium sp. (Nauphoeta cinerea)]AGW86146.1 Ribosomal RNA small subunit methyltransferase H [Blattabacterium sp. (Nauphoeta cinerea)]